MGYKFYFDNVKDAGDFYSNTLDLAIGYGKVSLADLYELMGISSNWRDTKTAWSEHAILDNVHVHPSSLPGKQYYVELPEPTEKYPCKAKSRYTPANENTTTSEPLNITICMDPSKDPYTTVREVIRQANEIKDRPVFITIN